MSVHSEDNYENNNGSFWEPGNYKTTTKRIEDGNKLCSELMALVAERAEIEKSYSGKLKNWAVKWNKIIESGPEYGTTEAGWKAVLVEADRRSELHTRVRDDLHDKVNTRVKTWQKDSFHKTMMQLKEKKEMDDQFKKAQKQWAKLYKKVQSAKSDYHNACKAEKTAVTRERNAAGDGSSSADSLRKFQDAVQKAKDQVVNTRNRYESCLQDVNNYNAKYMEDMTEVFERCQRMEAQRLQFFKEMLFEVQKCLNVADDPMLPQIYEEFHHTVNNADHEKDLRWWSNTYGVNMPMNWPQFEEYSEEFRDIAGAKGKSSSAVADGSIKLLNQRSVGDDLPEFNSTSVKQNGGAVTSQRNGGQSYSKSGGGASTASTNKTPNNGYNSSNNSAKPSSSAAAPPIAEAAAAADASKEDTNPFDDDWDDDLVDNGEPGVKVKALYDYEAAEGDELDFKIGDIFEKLEDEDEQGWCKGRKDGRVGLYPANYVELA